MQEHIWWDFASFRSWRTTITEINQNTYEEEKEEKKKKRKEKRGCECLAESPIHMSMLNSPSVLFQSYGVHKHMKDDRTRLVHWDTKHFMFNSEERQGCRRWTPPPILPLSLCYLSHSSMPHGTVCVWGGDGQDTQAALHFSALPVTMRDLSHTSYNSTLLVHAGSRTQWKSVSKGKNETLWGRGRSRIILPSVVTRSKVKSNNSLV